MSSRARVLIGWTHDSGLCRHICPPPRNFREGVAPTSSCSKLRNSTVDGSGLTIQYIPPRKANTVTFDPNSIMGQAPSAPANEVLTEYPKKIYVHYEEGPEEHHCTLKMSVPKKWVRASMDQACSFFIENYNLKKKGIQLDPKEMHVEKTGHVVLFGDDTLLRNFKDREDMYIKSGPATYAPVKTKDDNDTTDDAAAALAQALGSSSEKLLKCQNYGCQKKYLESENQDGSCHSHLQPPTFHDTKKGWGCCKSRMVYDWDDFERIPTCHVGAHSAVKAPIKIIEAPPPVVAPVVATMSSIDDFNQKNPKAVTAVSALAPAPVPEKDEAPARTSGWDKCKNFGCQEKFLIEDNSDTKCRYHATGPVFHDSGKYWSCCPKQVKYDFDEFLAVPGCVVGPHSSSSSSSSTRRA